MSKYASPLELAQARADYEEAYLSQTCTIRRSEPGDSDSYGGRTNREMRVAELRCRVQRPRRPQSVEVAYQSVALGDWEILLPAATAVALGDRIDVGGQLYEVQGSDAGLAEALCVRAYCTRED